MPLTKHESADRQWFAVTGHEALVALGDCGDYEAAFEAANDMFPGSIRVLISPQTAVQWLISLEAKLGKLPTTEKYISQIDGKYVIHLDTDEDAMPCNTEGPTNLRVFFNDDIENPIWDN